MQDLFSFCCYVTWCLLQSHGSWSLCLCFGSVLSTTHREALLDKESEISSLLERLRIREGEIQRIREDEAQRASFLQNAILTYVQGSPLAHFSPKKWTWMPRPLWFFRQFHQGAFQLCIINLLQVFTMLFEGHIFMNWYKNVFVLVCILVLLNVWIWFGRGGRVCFSK